MEINPQGGYEVTLIVASFLTPDDYSGNMRDFKMLVKQNSSIESKTSEYTLGLDIGIASVGWAVLADDHIIHLGVRAFNKAETYKGKSLNLQRRMARLLRRRLRRRASRLKRLNQLLVRERLVPDTDFFTSFKPNAHTESPWNLRIKGLESCLEDEEWARVIYHLCKHRGFYWVSRADRLKEGSGSQGEGGKIKEALAHAEQRLQEDAYRTAAEMVLSVFPGAPRNKQGDYSKALSRERLSKELTLLFERQRELQNPRASVDFEKEILGNGDHKTGLFWEQKPPLSGKDLLNMIRRCTFEKQECRAPKASFSAERHVWLTKLNNVRILTHEGSPPRPLNDSERDRVLWLPYHRKGKCTYEHVRQALELQGETFKFLGVDYNADKESKKKAGKGGKKENPERATLVDLRGWQEIRQTLERKGLAAEWEKISQSALAEGTSVLLDEIAWVLSVYKEDDEAKEQLTNVQQLQDKPKVIEALLNIRFDTFSNLSFKALRRILPHMAKGLRYDEACAKADYHHSQPEIKHKQRVLPSLYEGRDLRTNSMRWNQDMDIPRNPVVLRAINQARKVVNALVREYGAPKAVHIELARDLPRSKSERDKIAKEQEAYRQRNEEARRHFKELFHREPSGKDLLKWTLYKEQDGKSAYSLQPLDEKRVIDEDQYVEIDHVLPYSRSYDDSKNNQVLVFTAENRQKGNMTPYEYLEGVKESQRWRDFKSFVEGNKSYRQAKRRRLLRQSFDEDEPKDFMERNRNDTRYIGRFLKNYIEHYLQLGNSAENRRCVVLNGQLTAFLRRRWELSKVRHENDRHHALDAVVAAACTHRMVKRVADYSRSRELKFAEEGCLDRETGETINREALRQVEQDFPLPWPHFRDELNTRLYTDDVVLLREKLKKYGTYPESELARVRPVFVSRAPQRRNRGAAHKETIYGQPERLKSQGSATQRIPLAQLKTRDLDRLRDPDRNKKLYEAIRQRLEEHDGNAFKAFTPDQPLYLPDKKGQPTNRMVRAVTICIKTMSGIPVRGGIAENDTMLRVDVFVKNTQYYLVPVYVHHLGKKELPDKAIICGKNEEAWLPLDTSYTFLFSLHPNDYIEVNKDVKNGAERIRAGYFSKCDRSTGAIELWTHDRGEIQGMSDEKGLIRGIGVKTVSSLRKFHVDVLGRRYPAVPESRQPLL